MQAASRAHNWQTFPVSGKSKLSRRGTHRLRRGVRVKNTHGLSWWHGLVFSRIFLTRLFHCMVMLTDSDASVIGALKSWARNELAQNPLNHHIINGIDKTHKSIELIKKNPWKRQIRALRDIRVFFWLRHTYRRRRWVLHALSPPFKCITHRLWR